MKNQITMNASNYDSFRYIEPYIRYTAHDYYDGKWELNRRKVSDYEFLLFTGGEGTFTIEERCYNVRKNDLLLFKPGLWHSGASVKTPFSFMCIHFDIFAAKPNGVTGCGQNMNYDTIPSKPVKYEKAVIDFPEFVHVHEGSNAIALLNKILIENQKKENGCKVLIGTFFTQLFLGLLRQQAQSCLQKEYNKEIEGIIRFIEGNFKERIHLADISREVHLQPAYISNLFKRHTGITLTEYITLFRISEAKKMLLEKDGKISEIAFETGFYDVHHFSRAFKKYEGVSPGEYRKMNFLFNE